MKLGTLKDASRDGRLVVVSRDLTRAIGAEDIAPNLQAALDDWSRISPLLEARFAQLQSGSGPSFALELLQLAAPLPRAYAWIDSSPYLSHMERATKLRGGAPAKTYKEEPLLYDGLSSRFIPGHDPLPLSPGDLGMDIEGELAVLLDDVPQGTPVDQAGAHVKLMTLVNDISLRTVIQRAFANGELPLFHGKPPCSMAPVAVTPDELGSAWDGKRLRLPLRCSINGLEIGRPDAGADMHFDFPTLISAATRMRPLVAGTVFGSGTISNRDTSAGTSCIAERRMLEVLEGGHPITPYLKTGDRVRIEMLLPDGSSVFGPLDQAVVAL